MASACALILVDALIIAIGARPNIEGLIGALIGPYILDWISSYRRRLY